MAKAYIPKDLRARVADTARHRCGYCLTQEAVIGSPMEIDHLIPESLGGPTSEENLWLACSLCNAHKRERIAAFDPQTATLVRFFNPRRDDWDRHFVWTDGGRRILGLTPAGRATVTALHLNRAILVRARQAWSQVGWHPPRD